MALAQPQVLGDLPHRDVLVPVVLADVIHRLEDILALVPLLPLRQGGGGPAPFRLHTAAQLDHRRLQLPVVEGLQQEVHRSQAQGAPGIGEAVVGGENDHIGPAAPGPQCFHHLNAVHIGHLQVSDDEGGVVPLHSLQGLEAVSSLPHHHTVQRGPVHSQDDPLPYHLLILHHQYLQHISSSFHRGSEAVTAAPGPPGREPRRRPYASP